jgi:hypothetical protein
LTSFRAPSKDANTVIINFLTIVLLQWCAVLGATIPLLSPQGFKTREVDVHAPELYADDLDFTATLTRLPGANNKQSYWQLSYQLFFIPEDKYYEALRRAPKGPSNPTAEDFPGRILLAEGQKKLTGLSTPKNRMIVLSKVPFREKVPDALRTKFSYLMTAYSVKIFDAELKTTVYQSGIFLTEPFEVDAQDQKQAIARKNIYLTFAVTSEGTLNYSQLRPRTMVSASQ